MVVAEQLRNGGQRSAFLFPDGVPVGSNVHRSLRIGQTCTADCVSVSASACRRHRKVTGREYAYFQMPVLCQLSGQAKCTLRCEIISDGHTDLSSNCVPHLWTRAETRDGAPGAFL